MKIRLMFALLVVALIGLSACGKTEQSGQEQAQPQTGTAEQPQGTAQPSTEPATGSAPESGQSQ